MLELVPYQQLILVLYKLSHIVSRGNKRLDFILSFLKGTSGVLSANKGEIRFH